MLFISGVFILASYRFKLRLRALNLTQWLGWALIGTCLPLLLGQSVAWFLITHSSGPNDELSRQSLSIGLAGGLGWFLGCLYVRFFDQKT